jgi:predicted RNA-binding protein Jag
MENTLQIKIKKMVELMGLTSVSVEVDSETKRVSVLAGEEEWLKKFLPDLVESLKYLINVMARKEGAETYFVDVNNYRKDRERLIAELAKAAAQKVANTKTEVRLPAMNSYERRIVHTELSMRPDVKTESSGEGRERCVVVRPL